MELMKIRRELMMQNGLPFEYKKIEYLEGVGAQYIDTMLSIAEVSDLNTNWDLTFSMTDFNKVYIIAGVNDNFKQLPIMIGNINHFRMDYAIGRGAGYFKPDKELETNIIYIIRQKDGILSIDDSIYPISVVSESETHFGIFCKYYANGTIQSGTVSHMKFYGFIAKHNGITFSNIVPCIRKSDNKPGAYDVVRKIFLTNRGSGEFIIPQ